MLLQVNPKLTLLTIAFALLFCVSLALAEPGVAMPKGETVVDFAWADRANLTLLVQVGGNYALRRLDIARDEISVIPVPASFRRINPADTSLAVSLSPQGNAVGFLGSPDGPLAARELVLYRLEAGGLETVNLRRIPKDFLVDGYTWGPRGESVYIWARHYLSVDQPYSVGKVHLRTGMFSGIALKEEIDLVDDALLLRGRGLLALKCLGYMGEYPPAPDAGMVALIGQHGDEPSLLHVAAGHLALNALASGELLLYEPGCLESQFGECELWLLPVDSLDLAKGKLPHPEVAEAVQSTKDGKWLAYLQAGEPAAGLAQGSQTLELLRIKDKKSFSTKVACSMFALSPGGNYVSATTPGRDVLYFYPLDNES